MSIERLLDRPVLKNLRNLVATIRAVSFVFAVLGAIVVVIHLLFSRQLIEMSIAWGISVALAVVVTTVVGFWLYTETFGEPCTYELTSHEAIIVVTRVNSHQRYEVSRKRTVRAKRNNVRLIEFRSHWTGQGSVAQNATSLVKEHVLFDGRRSEEDHRVYRWIFLHGALSRGESVETGIRYVLEDDIEPMHSYWAEGGGRYRTRNLKLTIRFPLATDPVKVKGAVWSGKRLRPSSVVGSVDFERLVSAELGTVDYVVVVSKPRRHHTYGIRWNWL